MAALRTMVRWMVAIFIVIVATKAIVVSGISLGASLFLLAALLLLYACFRQKQIADQICAVILVLSLVPAFGFLFPRPDSSIQQFRFELAVGLYVLYFLTVSTGIFALLWRRTRKEVREQVGGR